VGTSATALTAFILSENGLVSSLAKKQRARSPITCAARDCGSRSVFHFANAAWADYHNSCAMNEISMVRTAFDLRELMPENSMRKSPQNHQFPEHKSGATPLFSVLLAAYQFIYDTVDKFYANPASTCVSTFI
jgi:hypothetical protein